jgi:hypothetical protein
MYENYWEGVVDFLQELLDKAGFVKGDPMLHMGCTAHLVAL